MGWAPVDNAGYYGHRALTTVAKAVPSATTGPPSVASFQQKRMLS
jgi:hypothetical protein